jgi:Excalibur calcium-binding domain
MAEKLYTLNIKQYKKLMQNLRNNKKVRLAVIVFLLLVVVVLYFRNVNTGNLTNVDGAVGEMKENFKPDTLEKKFLLGAFAILGAALGLEASNNDFDLQKLIETKGDFKASRVLRDKSGNIVTAEDIAAGKAVGKGTDEYNCDDFKTQGEAQGFYDKAGGVKGDTNGLDGDKNGQACQALPKK